MTDLFSDKNHRSVRSFTVILTRFLARKMINQLPYKQGYANQGDHLFLLITSINNA
jgi:hypothetical protein